MLLVLKTYLTVSADMRIVPLTVKNNLGTLLPSTSGIGITNLCTIGGLLIVGTAVMLVLRKKK